MLCHGLDQPHQSIEHFRKALEYVNALAYVPDLDIDQLRDLFETLARSRLSRRRREYDIPRRPKVLRRGERTEGNARALYAQAVVAIRLHRRGGSTLYSESTRCLPVARRLLEWAVEDFGKLGLPRIDLAEAHLTAAYAYADLQTPHWENVARHAAAARDIYRGAGSKDQESIAAALLEKTESRHVPKLREAAGKAWDRIGAVDGPSGESPPCPQFDFSRNAGPSNARSAGSSPSA